MTLPQKVSTDPQSSIMSKHFLVTPLNIILYVFCTKNCIKNNMYCQSALCVVLAERLWGCERGETQLDSNTFLD